MHPEDSKAGERARKQSNKEKNIKCFNQIFSLPSALIHTCIFTDIYF